jgi:hypothetical protein
MKMKRFLPKLLSISILMVTSTLLAQSAAAQGLNGPHQHGEFEMTVLKADGQVVFNIVAPAKNIAGFEHAPKTAAEKAKALKAESSLYEVDNLNNLFQFSPKGACQPYESYVNSDILNIHSHTKEKNKSYIRMLAENDHPEKKEDDVHVVGVGGHSDFVMSYIFDCEKVDSVTLGFAKQFPSLKKINLRAKNLSGKIIKTFVSGKKSVIDFK